MKKFFSEFKQFAIRGNVMDLAVGVIIGTAFQGIVNSLVGDIISPIIGMIANQDLSDLVLMVGDVPIKYGSFLTAVINFILMAFVIFCFLRLLNKLMSISFHQKKEEEKKQEEAAPTTKICPYCRSEIPVEATRCAHCTSQLEDAQ